MSHTSTSPAHDFVEQFEETLKLHLNDVDTRRHVAELAIEEFECQFADADDAMIIAGQEVLDAAAGVEHLGRWQRRLLIESIWKAMAEKGFGR
jgi:hypothetical protein